MGLPSAWKCGVLLIYVGSVIRLRSTLKVNGTPYRVLISTLAFALLAFAISAQMASAANPEFWKSEKAVPSGSNIPYTWSGGQMKWRRAEELWECSSSSGEGKITNSTEGEFKLTLKGCEWHGPEGTVSCHSSSGGKGTILTEPLKTHLYYGRNYEGVRGALMDFSPSKAGEPVAKFSCLAEYTWKGSLLGAFEKVNQETSTNSLVLRQHGSAHEQEYKEYETANSECSKLGTTEDYLKQNIEGLLEGQVGFEAPNTISLKEKVEIHAPCIP
jgi:hypothetical protein